MQNSSGDERLQLKWAQLWHFACHSYQIIQKSYSRNCVINDILKDDFNVNQIFTLDYKFTSNSESRLKVNIHLKNCTALHFFFYVVQDIDRFTTLIARGADYTIKNGNGQTALHLMITQHPIGIIQQKILFINSVLSAHIESQNFINPQDNDGISHFHGACMANHIEAAKLFLDNGASINEAVNLNAPHFPGWAPLHFAVAFGGFKVVQILIEHGANVNARTAKGENPLDLLFDVRRTACHSQHPVDKEQLVQLLVEKGAISAVGLSTLQVACSLKDLTMAEQLLDEGADIEYAVPSKSHIRPGHTALHFAAKNGIEAVKMLMKRGAEFNLPIVQNDPMLRHDRVKYSLQELCDILSCINNLKELRLSDGQTKLLDLILAMESLDNFRRFLQNETVDVTAVVSDDSVLWPGYTILHLAVTFSQSNTTIVEECLNCGSNLNVPNLEEQTPIHLAYIHYKNNTVRLMLERLNQLDTVTNLVDKNNLSYLHIACAIQDEALADRLLGASDPDDHRRRTLKSVRHMEAGSTPLHAAVSGGSRAIAELLLRRGADLHATDASGLTPIHQLYKHMSSIQNHEIVGCLMDALSTNVVDRVVDGLGLSYLHIACVFGYVEIIEKLLDLGSNINAAIEGQECNPKAAHSLAHRFLSTYASFTPLQMAIYKRNPNDEVLTLSLHRGADVFETASKKLVKQRRCCRAPIENSRVRRRFFQILFEREDMQKSMEQRLGLTKLHVACYLKDEEAVRSALTDAVDVNVPLYADSLIFAGCTPLHLLVTASVGANFLNAEISIGSMVKMLLDRGADVFIANVEKATPIHVFNTFQRFFPDHDLCKNLLLEAHRDFSVNPVNDKGWSHFHIACYWHRVEIVQKFLQRGFVNVNQPLDYFIGQMAGCTPLHLALSQPMTEPNADWTKMLQTIDLLLKHGADIAAKDVSGNTPLHTQGALHSPGMSILEKLLSYGGDIKCENLHGQSPIEQFASINATDDNHSENLAIFRRYGYRINSWNRLTGEGYIAKIFLWINQRNLSEISEFQKFVESSDARTVDDLGRTAIHNAVAISGSSTHAMSQNCIYAIESFMKIGIDIDYRDKSGQTALHYAVRMGNWTNIKALLLCGADINIDDNNEESSFTYAIKIVRGKSASSDTLELGIAISIALYVRKLQHLKLEVSHMNQNLLKEAQTLYNPTRLFMGNNVFNISQTILSQIEMTKTMDVKTNSLTLYDFLSDTAALTLYPFLLKSERELVDRFFESADYNELTELVGIVKLQTRKMWARLGLIDSALSSLRMLLGFSVPGLCEHISRFLLNSDLKNLIESTTPKARKRKLSEISS